MITTQDLHVRTRLFGIFIKARAKRDGLPTVGMYVLSIYLGT